MLLHLYHVNLIALMMMMMSTYMYSQYSAVQRVIKKGAQLSGATNESKMTTSNRQYNLLTFSAVYRPIYTSYKLMQELIEISDTQGARKTTKISVRTKQYNTLSGIMVLNVLAKRQE